MHHVCAPKKMLVGLLALVLGALITGSAAAAGQQVIPYLSHGVGVDQSAYSGTSTSTKTPLVIPYLSHGHGVDQSLYVGGSHHLRRTAATAPAANAVPDALDRAVARLEQSESTAAATRPDDREGLRGINPTLLSGVTSSTSLRPDDRSGSRGIGVTSTVETASSSSSTDWSPAFYAGAGFLGAMLVAGGALALTRRQHGGIATR
ncbi:MAG TPA: hypothetical protein VLK36_01990 [Gaiellaceae bacterium]|nr:hypothetical protein [Gaiellaceae bacterium]